LATADRSPVDPDAWHDDAGPGGYFVTVCVADNRPLLGAVVNGRMALNEAGRIGHDHWRI
jgi:hypothetical protein